MNHSNLNHSINQDEEIDEFDYDSFDDDSFEDENFGDENLKKGSHYNSQPCLTSLDQTFIPSNQFEDYSFNDDSFSDDDDVIYDEVGDRNINLTRSSSATPPPNYSLETITKINSLIIEKDRQLAERKNLIAELFNTEHDYIKDLYFIIEKYIDRIKQSNFLSEEDFELIFGQFETIYSVNRKLYEDLNTCLENSSDSCFCELLLSHLKEMSVKYQKFFENQMMAFSRLQNTIETHKKFDELLKEIMIETGSHLPLISYLIKPMQRITRYPMLVEKIYKCTPKTHPDYDNCFHALIFAKKFCSKMNEACRQTENFDRLSWIEKNVRIPLKVVSRPIIFNSETSFLGPRRLIRYGVLVKPSGKILVAFLFNDFLMFAIPDRPQRDLKNVPNFFQNHSATKNTYTLYRRPFMLNELAIQNISDFESKLDPALFSVYLEREKRSLRLRAHSSNDCNQWLCALDSALRDFKEMRKTIFENQIQSVKPIGNLFLTISEAVQIYSLNSCIDAQCEIAIGQDWSTTPVSIFRTGVVSCLFDNKSLRNSLKFRNSVSNLKSSPSPSSSETRLNHLFTASILKGPFKIDWNSVTKLTFNNLNDNLLIRCYDLNPFEPRRCFGEKKISLKQLWEQCQSVDGTITQDIILGVPSQELFKNNNNDHDDQIKSCRPSLRIKFRIIPN